MKTNKGGISVEIKILEKHEKVPMELLLLADPSRSVVEDYVAKGDCFIAVSKEQIMGVLILIVPWILILLFVLKSLNRMKMA